VIEILNLDLKRKIKKIGAFPDDKSITRLTVIKFMDFNEE
jgi:transposase-like protein